MLLVFDTSESAFLVSVTVSTEVAWVLFWVANTHTDVTSIAELLRNGEQHDTREPRKRDDSQAP